MVNRAGGEPLLGGPVDLESTPSIIARRLREAIRNGAFPQGTQLIESELARELQVSRGPLREAMQRLSQEGLLKSIRHRGLFVATLSLGDVRDVYLARMAVERAAAHEIMRGGTSKVSLAAMRDRLIDMGAARDREAGSTADLRFHEQLVELAGSPRLTRMHETLLTETRMCLNALADTYLGEDSQRLAEHAAIVDAIASGDVLEVERLLRAHTDDALARIERQPV